MIKTISPATNKVVCEVPEASIDDARTIARQSEEAFSAWKDTPLAQRRLIIVKALGLIQERKMDLGRELSEQMGRPVSFSHKEIETTQKRADYLLDIAQEALAPLPGRAEAGFKRCIKKVPVGPTLIVFAWNVRCDHQQCRVLPGS
jgi:acyl-CoA reductase-like NAD-dependent aldehyde dehydrogenase